MLKKLVKTVYWKIMMWEYSWTLYFADFVMANGKWTQQHLKTLLGSNKYLNITYPPVNVTEFLGVDPTCPKADLVVSLA